VLVVVVVVVVVVVLVVSGFRKERFLSRGARQEHRYVLCSGKLYRSVG